MNHRQGMHLPRQDKNPWSDVDWQELVIGDQLWIGSVRHLPPEVRLGMVDDATCEYAHPITYDLYRIQPPVESDPVLGQNLYVLRDLAEHRNELFQGTEEADGSLLGGFVRCKLVTVKWILEGGNDIVFGSEPARSLESIGLKPMLSGRYTSAAFTMRARL